MKSRRFNSKIVAATIAALILTPINQAATIWTNFQVQEVIPCTSHEDSRKIPVLGMWLNTYWMQLNKGDSYQFKAYFAPANATNQKVNWVTNNEQAVKITQDGVVTAIAPGHALIICTSQDNGITAIAQVVVQN